MYEDLKDINWLQICNWYVSYGIEDDKNECNLV